jgi:hypothetical protein
MRTRRDDGGKAATRWPDRFTRGGAGARFGPASSDAVVAVGCAAARCVRVAIPPRLPHCSHGRLEQTRGFSIEAAVLSLLQPPREFADEESLLDGRLRLADLLSPKHTEPRQRHPWQLIQIDVDL